MPKLSEWHIYGNEQQGRFVTRKPESTLYYLANLTNDIINKNYFRILDKKQYELKDHLGNVRATIGDYKMPFNDATSTRGIAPFYVDEKSTMDYYAGGMAISDRSFSSNNSRYGYNGQEKSLEIDKFGNHNTAEYWEMDSRILRRWNLDPKPTQGLSQYSIFGNNPILYSDPKGDSIFVNNTGDIIRDTKSDNMVFLQEGRNISYIGSVGKGQTIDVSKIMPNLLKKNSETAKYLDIWGYFFKVKPNGDWDLKKNDGKEGKPLTIFGYAWASNEKEKLSDEEKTKFVWKGKNVFNNAADVGNYHAGYVGKFTYFGYGIPDNILFLGAGAAETAKDALNYYNNGSKNNLKSLIFHGTSLGIASAGFVLFSQSNIFLGLIIPVLPPAGDREIDYKYNKQGMEDAKKSK